MPHEIEVDVDKLKEVVDEEMEKGGTSMLRWISLTTAILAALAAVAALRAGATVNKALVMKTESTRLQNEASDQWAYYQAKGIKSAIAQADADAWTIAGKTPPPALAALSAKYVVQQDSSRHAAVAKEQERDARSHEADELLEQHHRFANAVALYQIAIALGAVAALTRVRTVWFASLLLGAAGTVLFGSPLMH